MILRSIWESATPLCMDQEVNQFSNYKLLKSLGQQQKVLKLQRLKQPKTVPKNEIWGRKNDSKPHTWRWRFHYFKFYSRKSQSQHKTIKKDHSFDNRISAEKIPLILRTLTYSTLWKMHYQNTAKNLTHFTNFPANIFLVACTVNVLNFSFNWNFWKFNYFSAFQYFHQ